MSKRAGAILGIPDELMCVGAVAAVLWPASMKAPSELHSLIHMLNDDAPGVSEAYAEIDGGIALVRIIGAERAGLPPECLVMSFPHPLPHSAEAVYAMLASIMADPVAAMLLLRASCSCTQH